MSSAMKFLLNEDQRWAAHHGDCIPHMRLMPEKSVDFTVFSPPFPAVYAYTNEACDIGNSEDLQHEARLHFSFFFRSILRVLKPGRVMAVHCQNIVRMKRSGFDGLYDFRGLLIRLAQRAGFIYQYDWAVRKNPQSQAIRTRSRSLQFAGLEDDRSNSRGSLPDYILIFKAPGENAIPIDSAGDVTRNQWIDWAECCWMDIKETDTLNVREGRGEQDTKHICALQLGVIDRLVRLYSNPDEIVFTPFGGVGSEPFGSLKLGRRAYACELKDEYFVTLCKNCERALAEHADESRTLFEETAA